MNKPKDVTCLPFTLIPQETEKTIRDAIHGCDAQFVDDMVEFGMVSFERDESVHNIDRMILSGIWRPSPSGSSSILRGFS